MTDWPRQQDNAAPPSAPFRLYVDPAFRPVRAEASRSKFLAGAAAIIAVGLIVATILLQRSERSATESLGTTGSAGVAAAQAPSAQLAMPVIPPIAAPTPADGVASVPVAEPSTDAPPTDKPIATPPAPEAPAHDEATHDVRTKPHREIRHRPTSIAPLQPRGDGPPVDVTDLPPLDPAVPQNGH
jgi:hypothetical protein